MRRSRRDWGSARADGLHEYLALAGTLALVMAIMFAVLLGGSTLERLVGRTVLDLQTRLFGLILAGIAAQLVVEGLGAVSPAWVTTESAIMDELRDGP